MSERNQRAISRRLTRLMDIEYLIDKRIVVLGRNVTIQKRSKRNAMGRFGGGWQWHLGIQGGGSTIIVSLVTFYVRIERRRRVAAR